MDEPRRRLWIIYEAFGTSRILSGYTNILPDRDGCAGQASTLGSLLKFAVETLAGILLNVDIIGEASA